MRTSIGKYFNLKIAFCCLYSIVICNGSPIQAAETKNEDAQKVEIFKQVITDLDRAIKTKDFNALNVENPERKLLSWGACGSDSRVSLSFSEMIGKLSKVSKNTKIIVNEQAEQYLYVTTIETKAWKGNSPYIYFEFKNDGMGWRWLGVYECASRSNDFRYEQGDELTEIKSIKEKNDKKDKQTAKRLNNLVVKLKKIIRAKDFKLLAAYVPTNKVYTWGPCGPGDVGYDEMSLKKITKMLLESSKGVAIYFNPKPTVRGDIASIETEGWTGECPFITFSFDFLKAKNAWIWNGACYSSTPSYETKKEGKYVATYFREPQLPRPGPRIFKHYSTLRARIAEIVQFKAFDALKPYAVKKVLTLGQCSLEMMEKDGIVGKEAPVQDVINFLKSNTPTTGEIVSSGMQHKTYYETTGWTGEYPFIAFWFSEKDNKWELAGVSYCNKRHFDLFPHLSPLK